MSTKLGIILSLLIGLVLAAPVPKGKAPATKAPASKAKAPAAKAPAVVAKGRAPVAVAAKRPVAVAAKAKAPAPRLANSRAVYSRTPVRYARVAPGRRVPTRVPAAPPVPVTPSADRYREIQQALADKGFYKGEVNGTWSAESVAALKDFQRTQNLEADGKLGSLSLIAMGLGPKRVLAAENTPPANSQPPASQQPQR